MRMDKLEHYRRVQDAARSTLDGITEFIKPGISEVDIVRKCDELQRAAGVDAYWYKSLPALVLVGDRTSLAISREPYEPSDTLVRETDLVTIDLNPAMGGFCGDYARTYYVEAGATRRTPVKNKEFLTGAHAEEHLHLILRKVAHTSMTFNDLYQLLHEEIDRLGFEQLDHLGHGVQEEMTHLDFVAPGVTRTLGEAELFTLEPQIRLKGGRYGFKHENIYYFQGSTLQEL